MLLLMLVCPSPSREFACINESSSHTQFLFLSCSRLPRCYSQTLLLLLCFQWHLNLQTWAASQGCRLGRETWIWIPTWALAFWMTFDQLLPVSLTYIKGILWAENEIICMNDTINSFRHEDKGRLHVTTDSSKIGFLEKLFLPKWTKLSKCVQLNPRQGPSILTEWPSALAL